MFCFFVILLLYYTMIYYMKGLHGYKKKKQTNRVGDVFTCCSLVLRDDDGSILDGYNF